MIKTVFRVFHLLLIALLLIVGCAQQGSPTGGPKDEDPPVVVETNPPNYSRNFDAKKIFISFDEYIVLDNVNQELIVSPPMEEKPEIKLRKKTIIIEFEEGLKENTTYTFNFGNAIKDLHEGNKLINYEYVFATGDEIDSLSVKGMLRNSFDLTEPENPVTIMLYDDLRDSVPLTETPLYVGKSRPDGSFSVNNLRQDVYKLFAIEDANYNFLFDQPNEVIAFLDSNLIVSAEYFRDVFRREGKLDSLQTMIDSLQTMADSALIDQDSLKSIIPNLNAVYVDLYLFTEENEIQFLTDYKRDDPRRLDLIFSRPLTDTFTYSLTGSDKPVDDLFLEIFSRERDSLTLWIRDSLVYKRDSVGLMIQYTVKDSMDNPVTATDSLLLTYRKKEPKKGRKENEEKVEQEKLKLQTIRKGQSQDLNRPLVLKSNFPITGMDKSLISLYMIPDTIEKPLDFIIAIDTTRYSNAYIKYPWESDMKYRMKILPGAVHNLYDLPHDTIDVSFTGRDSESYGKIILNLENVKGEIIVQLMIKDKVVNQMTVNSSGTYEFPFLNPDTYSIKFIHDRNGNGKWDTGKYIKKIQPEKVEKLPIDITVRAHWDHDATYKFVD